MSLLTNTISLSSESTSSILGPPPSDHLQKSGSPRLLLTDHVTLSTSSNRKYPSISLFNHGICTLILHFSPIAKTYIVHHSSTTTLVVSPTVQSKNQQLKSHQPCHSVVALNLDVALLTFGYRIHDTLQLSAIQYPCTIRHYQASHRVMKNGEQETIAC